MSDDTAAPFLFPAVNRKKVIADFEDGRITSDGGVMLLAATERRPGIAAGLAGLTTDLRNPVFVTRSVTDVLRARHRLQLSMFGWSGQRMLAVVPERRLAGGRDHGRQATCGGQRRAARGFGGAEPIARPREGGSGAGGPIHVAGLDQHPHCQGVRGARGHGAALAECLHAGRGRGAQDVPSVGANSRQGRHGAVRGRTDPDRAGGKSVGLDAGALVGRDRKACGRALVAGTPAGGAAPKRAFRWRRP